MVVVHGLCNKLFHSNIKTPFGKACDAPRSSVVKEAWD